MELNGTLNFFKIPFLNCLYWGSPSLLHLVSFSFFGNFHIALKAFIVRMTRYLHHCFSWNPFFQGQGGKGFSSSMSTDDFIFRIDVGYFLRPPKSNYFQRLVYISLFAQFLNIFVKLLVLYNRNRIDSLLVFF